MSPATADTAPAGTERERRPITMPAIFAIIALAVVAFIALTVVGFAVHLLFTPWLLVAIAIVAWIKFGPRRTRR